MPLTFRGRILICAITMSAWQNLQNSEISFPTQSYLPLYFFMCQCAAFANEVINCFSSVTTEPILSIARRMTNICFDIIHLTLFFTAIKRDSVSLLRTHLLSHIRIILKGNLLTLSLNLSKFSSHFLFWVFLSVLKLFLLILMLLANVISLSLLFVLYFWSLLVCFSKISNSFE